MTMTELVAILGSLGSIIGIPLAIYFYLQDRKRESKELSFCWRNIVVVDGIPKISGLNLLWFGKSISRLTISKIVIWNSGKKGISRDDFTSEVLPLYIQLESNSPIILGNIIYRTQGIEGFSAKPLKANNTNAEVLERNEKDFQYIGIDFQYIDANAGLVIQIIHQQEIDEELRLWVNFRNASTNRAVSKSLSKIYKSKTSPSMAKILIAGFIVAVLVPNELFKEIISIFYKDNFAFFLICISLFGLLILFFDGRMENSSINRQEAIDKFLKDHTPFEGERIS